MAILFASHMASKAAHLREQLQRAEAALAELEDAEAGGAFAAATGDDDAPWIAAKAATAAGRDRVRLVQLAVAEADRREAQRIADARRAAGRSRDKAIRAHLARLRLLAISYSVGIEKQRDAWRSIVDVVGKLNALAQNVPEYRGLRDVATATRVRQEAHGELLRIGADRDAMLSLPATSWYDLGASSPRERLPFESFIGRVIAEFNSSTRDPAALARNVSTRFGFAGPAAAEQEPVEEPLPPEPAEAEAEAETRTAGPGKLDIEPIAEAPVEPATVPEAEPLPSEPHEAVHREAMDPSARGATEHPSASAADEGAEDLL